MESPRTTVPGISTQGHPRRLPVVLLVALCAWVCCYVPAGLSQTATDGNTLRIQILSGKNGRPVTSVHVTLLRKDGLALDGSRAIKWVATDDEGSISVPSPDPAVADVYISVALHRPCSKTGRHNFELARVRASGVVSENSCSPRIKLFPQAGTLVFFVRDETFLERLHH